MEMSLFFPFEGPGAAEHPGRPELQGGQRQGGEPQAQVGESGERAPRGGLFRDYSNRHSDLRRHENWFLGLMSAWKPVFRADISVETGFHAGVGQDVDWNHL